MKQIYGSDPPGVFTKGHISWEERVTESPQYPEQGLEWRAILENETNRPAPISNGPLDYWFYCEGRSLIS